MSLQRRRVLLELGLHLEHDAVLVELREDRRDLPLAEGVVERVVDRCGVTPSRDAVSRSIVDVRLQPAVLLVAGDVGELRQRAQRVDAAAATHVRKLGRVGVLERVLVLRAADAVLDGQVLHRLHVERDAVDVGEPRLQPADDLASR